MTQRAKRRKLNQVAKEEETEALEMDDYMLMDSFSDDDFGFEDMSDDLQYSEEESGKGSGFQVMSSAEVHENSMMIIKRVQDFLSIEDRIICLALLVAFEWNEDQLLAAFLEDPDRCYDKAEIDRRSGDGILTENQEGECPICLEDYAGNAISLACGHRACLGCYLAYVKMKLVGGSHGLLSYCIYPNCKYLLRDTLYHALGDDQLIEKCNQLIGWSYVDLHPLIKWCPFPNCNFAVKGSKLVAHDPVTCKCGGVWCFNCNDFELGDHLPATCEQVEMWRKKASDESDNVLWMTVNTKMCPNCHCRIEKNGGCMHMTCRKEIGGCGHHFCWLCRAPWSEHGSQTGGYYSCNKYSGTQQEADDKNNNLSKTELEHYTFYYHRYDSHMNAFKIAVKQEAQCPSRQTSICTQFGLNPSDVAFLAAAVKQLIRCRRVLRWSYAYGYSVTKPTNGVLKMGVEERNHMNLFEYLQEDVEKHTDRLSELYERTIDQDMLYQDFILWKADVAQYTRVSDQFLDNFVKGVGAGLAGSRLQ